MKYLQRFCCLLCVFVLSLGVFSPIVNAAEISVDTSKVHMSITAHNAGVVIGQTDILLGESGIISDDIYHAVGSGGSNDMWIDNSILLANTDSSAMFLSGNTYQLLLENIVFTYSYLNDITGESGTFFYQPNSHTAIEITFIYTDGTRETVVPTTSTTVDYVIYNPDLNVHSLKYEFTPSKDIRKIEFSEFIHGAGLFDYGADYVYLTLTSGAMPMKLTVEKVDKSEGFLSGILENVINIGNKVSDTFDTISSGFANIGTWFAELPSKIWNVMSEGIKGLFVPDNDYMAGYSDKWDLLLADRFGAIYQVCDIVANSWDGIMAAETDTVLDFPEVSIPIGSGETFTFGGYKVRVMPAQFRSQIRPFIITITSIICTVAFINGLLKRYDEIFGGKS